MSLRWSPPDEPPFHWLQRDILYDKLSELLDDPTKLQRVYNGPTNAARPPMVPDNNHPDGARRCFVRSILHPDETGRYSWKEGKMVSHSMLRMADGTVRHVVLVDTMRIDDESSNLVVYPGLGEIYFSHYETRMPVVRDPEGWLVELVRTRVMMVPVWTQVPLRHPKTKEIVAWVTCPVFFPAILQTYTETTKKFNSKVVCAVQECYTDEYCASMESATHKSKTRWVVRYLGHGGGISKPKKCGKTPYPGTMSFAAFAAANRVDEKLTASVKCMRQSLRAPDPAGIQAYIEAHPDRASWVDNPWFTE